MALKPLIPTVADFNASLSRLASTQLQGAQNGALNALGDAIGGLNPNINKSTTAVNSKRNTQTSAAEFGSPAFRNAINASTSVPATGQFPTDERARLSLAPGAGDVLYNSGGILSPLQATSGLIFPYTPAINVSHNAEYETQGLAHTNYSQHSYMRSGVDQISVVGTFTAETQEEGRYMLAAIHFLKSATKMFYGRDSNRGTPPPVLRLSAHGTYMYDSLPVVVSQTNFDFPTDVDYIEVDVTDSPRNSSGFSNTTTRVPTNMMLNVTLLVVASRTRTLDFSLREYATGGLLGLAGNKGTFA